MAFLGLDASTKNTGYCIMDSNKKIIDYGCLTENSSDVVKRIQNMAQKIKNIIDKNEIEKIILEEVRPPQGDEYGSGNLQTHRVLMWLQGQIFFVAHDKKIPVEYLLPSSWRKRCGIKQGGLTRQSLKAKDIQWVKDNYNLSVNDDIADAIGIVYGFLTAEKKDFNWE